MRRRSFPIPTNNTRHAAIFVFPQGTQLHLAQCVVGGTKMREATLDEQLRFPICNVCRNRMMESLNIQPVLSKKVHEHERDGVTVTEHEQLLFLTKGRLYQEKS